MVAMRSTTFDVSFVLFLAGLASARSLAFTDSDTASSLVLDSSPAPTVAATTLPPLPTPTIIQPTVTVTASPSSSSSSSPAYPTWGIALIGAGLGLIALALVGGLLWYRRRSKRIQNTKKTERRSRYRSTATGNPAVEVEEGEPVTPQPRPRLFSLQRHINKQLPLARGSWAVSEAGYSDVDAASPRRSRFSRLSAGLPDMIFGPARVRVGKGSVSSGWTGRRVGIGEVGVVEVLPGGSVKSRTGSRMTVSRDGSSGTGGGGGGGGGGGDDGSFRASTLRRLQDVEWRHQSSKGEIFEYEQPLSEVSTRPKSEWGSIVEPLPAAVYRDSRFSKSAGNLPNYRASNSP